MLITGGYCGLHYSVCQPGKLSLQMGILPSFWLSSTSLQKQTYLHDCMQTGKYFEKQNNFATMFPFHEGHKRYNATNEKATCMPTS